MARSKDFDEQEVLNKAIDLFWLKGYNATSMQDLVDALGISRSSLYDTFGDKHSLFLKALESYKTSAGEKISTIAGSTPSAKEAIRRLFDFTINELLSDTRQKGCFLVNAGVEVASVDPTVNEMVCDNDQQLEKLFFTIIKNGQETGELSKDKDAHAIARFMLNTVKGMRVTAKTATDKSVFNDIVAMTLNVLN
ncbi:TetR/AcrR family transcriptional regulator [Mucilaginibacter sp. RS28]|uniref:TetR/AcrR family transcriptional regulator n=1 Tax=Mucilaginibacter straminoryzae TaxID=2932774 RepID=A0A9X1X2B9_9SPHI|nr:TetR/AcrR family transcriptional regulator [Mucilaginibacter straminoryzae]MCJ8209561.1 TetR/AcrR family transcriptional regulator [Mucilaginibacter straminoryzae]